MKTRKNLVPIHRYILVWKGQRFSLDWRLYISQLLPFRVFSIQLLFTIMIDHFVFKLLIINSCPGYCLFNSYQSYCLFQSIITQVVDISILNLFSFHSIFLIVSITVERWQVCKKFWFSDEIIFADFLDIFLCLGYKVVSLPLYKYTQYLSLSSQPLVV